jgi:hypothetical protein
MLECFLHAMQNASTTIANRRDQLPVRAAAAVLCDGVRSTFLRSIAPSLSSCPAVFPLCSNAEESAGRQSQLLCMQALWENGGAMHVYVMLSRLSPKLLRCSSFAMCTNLARKLSFRMQCVDVQSCFNSSVAAHDFPTVLPFLHEYSCFKPIYCYANMQCA